MLRRRLRRRRSETRASEVAHAMTQYTRPLDGERAGRRPPVVSVEEQQRRREAAEASAKVTAEMIAKAKASRPRLGEWEEEV